MDDMNQSHPRKSAMLAAIVFCSMLAWAPAGTVVHPKQTRTFPQDHGTLIHEFQVTDDNGWRGGTFVSGSLAYQASETSAAEPLARWSGLWEGYANWKPKILFSHGLGLLQPPSGELLVLVPSGEWRCYRFTQQELDTYPLWVRDQTDWDQARNGFLRSLVEALDPESLTVTVRVLSGYDRTLQFTIRQADGTLSLEKLTRQRRRIIQAPLKTEPNYALWVFLGCVAAAVLLLYVVVRRSSRGEPRRHDDGAENKPSYWIPVFCIAGVHGAAIFVTMGLGFLAMLTNSRLAWATYIVVNSILFFPLLCLRLVVKLPPGLANWNGFLPAYVMLTAIVIGIPVYRYRRQQMRAGHKEGAEPSPGN